MEEQFLSRDELIVVIYNLEMQLFTMSRNVDWNGGGAYTSDLPELKTVINKLRQLLLSME